MRIPLKVGAHQIGREVRDLWVIQQSGVSEAALEPYWKRQNQISVELIVECTLDLISAYFGKPDN